MRQNRITCPSELVPEEPWDDTICAQCQTELPEEDPDPDGASPWWEGFCSDGCRVSYSHGLGEHLSGLEKFVQQPKGGER